MYAEIHHFRETLKARLCFLSGGAGDTSVRGKQLLLLLSDPLQIRPAFRWEFPQGSSETG